MVRWCEIHIYKTKWEHAVSETTSGISSIMLIDDYMDEGTDI